MFISYLGICFKNFGLTTPLTSLGLLQHWLYIIRIVIIYAFFIADIESFPVFLVSTEHYFIFLKFYWKSWFAMLCSFRCPTKWFSYILFSHSVMSDSLRPHGLPWFPCPFPRICLNLCPLSQRCHPTILSSVSPFSYLQSLPASGSFPMSCLFTLGSQSIGASASVLPMNIQGWFSLGLTGLILQSKGLSSLLQDHSSKASILQHSAFFMSRSHIRTWLLEKNIALTLWTYVGKVMSPLFNMLCRFSLLFFQRASVF